MASRAATPLLGHRMDEAGGSVPGSSLRFMPVHNGHVAVTQFTVGGALRAGRYMCGSTSSASSPPAANSWTNSMLVRINEAMTAVDAFPTRSHTTLGGGLKRNANCRKSESFDTIG